MSSSLPNNNIELLLGQLPVGSLVPLEFIPVLRGLQNAKLSNHQFNWVLDHFENLYSALNDV